MMTPNRTGVSIQDPIIKLIQNLPTDRRALHDIRFRFKVHGIWSLLSTTTNPQLPVNPTSKDIMLKICEIDRLNDGTLQPVRVSDDDRGRIIELFKESKPTFIDLSSPSMNEERFRINYQGLFAILSDLVNNRIDGLEMKITKRNDPVINFRIN